MTKKKHDLDIIESLIYYVGILVTFGAFWFAKIIIKKAIIEANDIINE